MADSIIFALRSFNDWSYFGRVYVSASKSLPNGIYEINLFSANWFSGFLSVETLKMFDPKVRTYLDVPIIDFTTA